MAKKYFDVSDKNSDLKQGKSGRITQTIRIGHIEKYHSITSSIVRRQVPCLLLKEAAKCF
jgi:hypothetical protein